MSQLTVVILLAIIAAAASSPQYNVGGSQVGSQGGTELTPDQLNALGSFWWEQPGADGTSDIEPTGAETSLPCELGYGCVPIELCVNGVIDVFGGAFLDKRSQFANCGGADICCKEPDYLDYIDGSTGEVPVGGDNPLNLPEICPDPSEDCVPFQLCIDGAIDTTGGAFLNPRSSPPVNCYSKDYPDIPSLCCRKPGYCPEHQECVPNNQCGVDGFIDPFGLTEYLQSGIECDLANGDYGICCTPNDFSIFLEPASQCGVRNYDETGNLDERIQSGYVKEDAYFGEFPWQVIIFLSNFTFQCGGSMISDRHILTAAHCVEYLSPHDIKIRLGEWQVNSFKEFIPYVDRGVKLITIHERYRAHGFLNNIAILELDEPVKFKYHINAICLPGRGQKFTGYCVATGWGKDSFYGDYQHILKKLDLPILNRGTCQNLLRNTKLGKYFRLHKSFVCAGGEEGYDTCTGDGGGPLVCRDPLSQQYYLAGIISAGLECGKKDVPALYTNVAYLSDWITQTISANGYSSLPGYIK